MRDRVPNRLAPRRKVAQDRGLVVHFFVPRAVEVMQDEDSESVLCENARGLGHARVIAARAIQRDDCRITLTAHSANERIVGNRLPTGGEDGVRLCNRRQVRCQRATGAVASASFRSDSVYGAFAMPRSVMMAATYFAGVTSKAGFSTLTPSGTICLPAICVTSLSLRCSIGMPLPSAVARSTVEIGAAT